MKVSKKSWIFHNPKRKYKKTISPFMTIFSPHLRVLSEKVNICSDTKQISIKLTPQTSYTQLVQFKVHFKFSIKITICNGSQLKDPDISCALYTLRIQYSYTQTQCEDGARDVSVLQLTPVTNCNFN